MVLMSRVNQSLLSRVAAYLQFSPALIGLVLLTSCDSVKFYEKERLADPIMVFGAPPSEAHFFAKNTYSREGSVGGIGTTAGGGCGCCWGTAFDE